MGKLNLLLGVANNLADSFVSVTNLDFLHHIESLPEEKTKSFNVNLLKEIITPDALSSGKVLEVIKKYKKWFLSEIKKLKIELNNIESVSIKVEYKKGRIGTRYYTCNTTITAKGKDYTKKSCQSYS
jgi:hypothetical protein